MTGAEIAFRYALCAAAATVVNLATQAVSLAAYDGMYALYLAMALGTGAGLVVKYALDKRFIFAFRAVSVGEDLVTFMLYSALSVATTLVFWGTELLFDALFPYEWAKFVGAAIGLTIGYTAKYFLSRRFVFSRALLRRRIKRRPPSQNLT